MFMVKMVKLLVSLKFMRFETFTVTVKGDVFEMGMVGFVDSGIVDATFDVEANGNNTELLGYCNQFSGNMFDENITQYESMAEFETCYGQVS